MATRVGGIDIVIRYDNDANSYKAVLQEIKNISKAGKSVSKDLKKGFGDVKISVSQVGQEVKKVSGMMSQLATGIKLAVGAFATGKMLDFGKSAIQTASDLEEVQNIIDVTFAGMTDDVEKFAKSAIYHFGLTEYQAKKMMGTFGSMLVSTGYTTDEALRMSKTMTALAGDIASFTNISYEQAWTALKAVISGETEAIENSIGATMKIASLQEYLQKHGLDVAWQNMTNAQHTLIRYNYLLEATKNMHGDFVRTSDQWANKIRVLKGSFETFKQTLGEGFIIALNSVIDGLQKLVGYLIKAAAYFTAFIKLIFGVKDKGNSASQAIAGSTDSLEKNKQAIDSNKEGLDALGKAAKKAYKQVASFDDVVTLSEPSSSSGADGVAGGLDAQLRDVLGIPELDFSMMEDSIRNKFEPKVEEMQEMLNNIKAELGISIDVDNLKSVAKKAWEDTKATLRELGDLIIFIGVSIAKDLDIGGIFERIVALVGKAMETLRNIVESVTPAFKAFYETGLQPIVLWIGGKLKDALDFAIAELDKWSQWFIENKDEIKAFGETVGQAVAFVWSLLEPFLDVGWEIAKGVISGVSDLLREMFDFILDNKKAVVGAITAVFVAWGAWKIIDKGLLIFQTTISILSNTTKIWSAVTTVATTVGSIFGSVMTFLTSPIGLVVVAIASAIAIGVLLYKNWDTIMAWGRKLIDWLKGIFVKDWGAQFGIVGEVIEGLLSNIKTVFDGVRQLFSGIIDFVAGVFTGDWRRAWEGVRNIFKGIFNSFGNIMLLPLQNLVDLINGIIKGLNNIKMPDWVPGMGGKGINIPLIPKPQIKLADGGVVTRATHALVGESGPEVVFPLKNSDFIDKFTSLVASKVSVGNSGSGEVNIHLHIQNLFGDQMYLKAFIREQLIPVMQQEGIRVGGVNFG